MEGFQPVWLPKSPPRALEGGVFGTGTAAPASSPTSAPVMAWRRRLSARKSAATLHSCAAAISIPGPRRPCVGCPSDAVTPPGPAAVPAVQVRLLDPHARPVRLSSSADHRHRRLDAFHPGSPERHDSVGSIRRGSARTERERPAEARGGRRRRRDQEPLAAVEPTAEKSAGPGERRPAHDLPPCGSPADPRYVPQRQRLPPSPARSSSVGCGLNARSDAAVMIWPAWQ